MKFKRFNLNIAFRIALITISIYFSFHLFHFTDLKITFVFFLIITAIVIFDLFYYIKKRNQRLKNFFSAIRSEDFSDISYSSNLGSAYDELKDSMNKVIKDFQKIRRDKEIQNNYLKNVLQHIGIAVLAYNNNEKIEFVNNSLKRMFFINRINDLGDFKKISLELYEIFKNLETNNKTLFKFDYKNVYYQLSIYSTKFKISEKYITIISLQNIHTELEQQEFLSWQKLLKVLRHEIMNSITPISSLASSLNFLIEDHFSYLKDNLGENVELESFSDIKEAVKTIEKRSSGLLHFVDKYRTISKISSPEFTAIKAKKLIKNVIALFRNELEENNIKISLQFLPENIQLIVDEKLIEQVLINLVKNAVSTLKEKKKEKVLKIKSFKLSDHIFIKIIDNGSGISQEKLKKIFVPFYTTKAKGNGIGLSISRQIMHLHKGRVTVKSKVGKGSEFSLIFRDF